MTAQKPNILLILADQHRYDCLGAYGNPDVQTPHIDRLAGEGVLFENSFCPHPVCTPSRYSMLSGLYIHQHRGLLNTSTLAPDIPTLPRQLKANGYRTTAVGKMHFTPTYLDVGFDEMVLAEQCGSGRYNDDYHRWLRSEGQCDRLDMLDQVAEYRRNAPAAYWETFGAMPSNLDEAHHSTTWIGERAIEALDQWNGEQNFLMAGFIKPHHPFDPPQPWASMYDPDELTVLPGWTDELIHGDDGEGHFSYADLSEAALRRVMALYYATISQIDHQVGRMVALLKAKGLYDNTLIVYTSDHGDFLGYHHRLLKGYHMLEPVMRVPLVIKYPAASSLQGKDSRLVNNIDLAPTLLSAAGIPVIDSMVGTDLADGDAGPEYVFAETRNEYMVRSKTRKLLLHREADQSMFFDLERDPLEMENLYETETYQAEIAALRSKLTGWPLFDERVENYLDYDAPQCQADNVPNGDTGLYAYFKDAIRTCASVGVPRLRGASDPLSRTINPL